MVTVLLVLLGAVLAAIAIVIALPVEVAVEAATAPKPGVRADVRFLGGLAPAIPINRGSETGGRTAKDPERKKGTMWRKRASSGGGARMATALPRLILRLLSRIRFHQLEIDGDLGLGDPADTGQAFGLIAPFAYALPHAQTRIAIRPDFAQARMEGRLAAEFRVTPAALLPPLARFGWQALWGRR